jgi:hypothetical protein
LLVLPREQTQHVPPGTQNFSMNFL